jgi:hypothetical protein
LRFVAAIVSFVLAFVLIGLGLAQRTIFAGPERLVAEGTTSTDAPLTLIEGDALHAYEGRQRLTVDGADDVVAVYGRTADVTAWIGEASHNVLSVDTETNVLDAELVEGEEDEVPTALGSDLWLAEFTGEQSLTFTANVPEGISVLIMSDGTAAAPSDVSISWPVDTRTPWAGPLLAAGGVLLLAGIGLYLWALSHWRKTRGPRRKSNTKQKLPRPPKYSARKAAKAVRPASPGATEQGRGRRASGRLRIAFIPTVLVGTLAFTGCSADSWPDFDGAASPSATPVAGDEITESALRDVAVTESQLQRIMTSVSQVATESDAATDADLLATRFEGPALEVRSANYVLRRADGAQPALTPIAAEPIALSLPQQTDAWPRVALVVVQDPDDETIVPTALVLNQETPRENYHVQYAVSLQATEFPDVAASTVGAVRYSPDNRFLKLAPEEVAAAYADVLVNGAESEFAEEFDLESDTFLSGIAGPEARAARAAAVTGPATLATTPAEGTGERIALATDNTGAILTLNFGDTETVTPTETGATISVGSTVRLMTGVTETTTGVYVTYGYQLLFYVPPAGSDEKIRLLGATEGVTAAGEL